MTFETCSNLTLIRINKIRINTINKGALDLWSCFVLLLDSTENSSTKWSDLVFMWENLLSQENKMSSWLTRTTNTPRKARCIGCRMLCSGLDFLPLSSLHIVQSKWKWIYSRGVYSAAGDEVVDCWKGWRASIENHIPTVEGMRRSCWASIVDN